MDSFLYSTTWQVRRQARPKLLQTTVAGVKSPLRRFADGRPDLGVIDGRFMVIEQTMGKSKGRPAAAKYLRGLIDELKASGFVAAGLKRSGQHDAVVAPAATD